MQKVNILFPCVLQMYSESSCVQKVNILFPCVLQMYSKSSCVQKVNILFPCVLQMYSKSSRQCEMKARLHHFESLYHDLQYENAALRSELQRKGVDIVELLAQKKQPVVDANANTSQSSHESAAGPRSGIERSPGKLKVAVEGGGGGGGSAQPLLLPQAPSRPPKTLPPKKERDLIVE